MDLDMIDVNLKTEKNCSPKSGVSCSRASCCLCGEGCTSRRDLPDCNAEVANAWKERCVVSICRIMRISSSDVSAKVLLATDNYCDSCEQLMRDVEFNVGAMDKLQQQILSFRQILLKKLESHKEGLDLQDSTIKKGTKSSQLNSESGNQQFAALYKKVKDTCSMWTDVDYMIRGSDKTSEKFLFPKSENSVTDDAIDDILDVQIKHEPLDDADDSMYELVGSNFREWETPAESTNLEKSDLVNDYALSENSGSVQNFDQRDSDPEWAPGSDDGLEDIDEEELQGRNMAECIPEDDDTEELKSPIKKEVGKRKVAKKTRPRIVNVLARSRWSKTRTKKKQVRVRKSVIMPCKKCDKTFTSLEGYRSHLRYHRQAESKEGQKTCAFCGIWLKVEDLEEHEVQHRGREFPFSCLICEDAKFHGIIRLSKHMREVHPSDDLQICQHCGTTFGTASKLRYHIQCVHQEASGSFECKECGKVFLRNYLLVKHTRAYHAGSGDSKQYICEECGKAYTSASSFYYHKQSHSSVLPYKCKICDKSFKLDKTLRKHEQIHSGLQFKCPECPKTFSTVQYLKQHSRCHLPGASKRKRREHPFKCDICDKGFQTSVGASKHKEVHAERPFECPEPNCPKSFSNTRNLRQHSRCHLPRELRKYYNKSKHTESPVSGTDTDESQNPEVILYVSETECTS